jgi:dTDP-glucose pyrophosphorylase
MAQAELSNVQTIITAAGASTPLFLASGFGVPKYKVEIEGTAILTRSLNSYSLNPALTCVGINELDEESWQISSAVQAFSKDARVALVPPAAQGALATALLAGNGILKDSPLVVAAGDSEVAGGIHGHIRSFLERGVDAGTIVFRSTNPRWSYLAVGEDGSVLQAAEKRVVGPYATTGVFFFRSADEFFRAAEWCLVNNAKVKDAFFVSTTLNFMIQNGMKVAYSEIQRPAYFSWSLPVDFVTEAGAHDS